MGAVRKSWVRGRGTGRGSLGGSDGTDEVKRRRLGGVSTTVLYKRLSTQTPGFSGTDWELFEDLFESPVTLGPDGRTHLRNPSPRTRPVSGRG